MTVSPVEDCKSGLTTLLNSEIGSNRNNLVYARIQADHTSLTWSAYQTALQNALSIETDALASPSEVTIAQTDLQNSISALVFAGQADLDDIIAAINALQEIDYNPTTWTSFTVARNTALLLPVATNAQVNVQRLALENALNLLRKDAIVSISTPIIAITEASQVVVDA